MELARKSVLFIFLSLFFSSFPLTAQALSHHSHGTATFSVIIVAELPPEARNTLQLIKNNGPFPYPRDGIVFGNYEHILPQQTRGYYHEYTVRTPGVRHRGARRIVCGIAPARGRPMGTPLLRSDPFALPECYYSADHYRSFSRIQEGSR